MYVLANDNLEDTVMGILKRPNCLGRVDPTSKEAFLALRIM